MPSRRLSSKATEAVSSGRVHGKHTAAPSFSSTLEISKLFSTPESFSYCTTTLIHCWLTPTHVPSHSFTRAGRIVRPHPGSSCPRFDLLPTIQPRSRSLTSLVRKVTTNNQQLTTHTNAPTRVDLHHILGADRPRFSRQLFLRRLVAATCFPRGPCLQSLCFKEH